MTLKPQGKEATSFPADFSQSEQMGVILSSQQCTYVPNVERKIQSQEWLQKPASSYFSLQVAAVNKTLSRTN